MTMPASAKGLGGRLPSPSERVAANQLRKIIAARSRSGAALHVVEEGQSLEITLAPALSELLMEVLRPIARGDAVTLVPVSQMLTTQQAADILNVSRPFLIGLLDRGEIEHTLIGRHRRIRADDLFAYKSARQTKRSKALADLAELDGETL